MKIATTTYLSIQHVQSLSYLVGESERLRELFRADRSDQNRTAYFGTCASAIFTSVSFLEALINELYSDAATGVPHIDVGGKRPMFQSLWNHGIPRTARYSVLEKYELMVELLGARPFDRGKLVYQDVDALIALRNALIHYEPEEVVVMSFTESEITVQKLAKRLSHRFAADTFYNSIGGFFPDRCLCASAVSWAYSSCLRFGDEFFQKIGTKPLYEHVRPALRKP